MSDHITLIISSIALLVSICSGAYVAFQAHVYLRQTRFATLSNILEVNRALLLAGFEHPELFDVLEGKTTTDGRKQKRYFQLWLNQVHLLWLAHGENIIGAEQWTGHCKDIQDLVSMGSFREHWAAVRIYYSGPFQRFIDSLVESEK